MDKNNYIYAVRNITTGNLQSARCNSGGKFYERKYHADQKTKEYNKRGYGSDYKHGEFKTVTFKLVEVDD